MGVRGGVGWRVRKWAGVGVGYTCETIHGTLYVVLRDVKQYMASLANCSVHILRYPPVIALFTYHQ